MIRSKLHEVAARNQIYNGYQFVKATGLPNSQGYYLWDMEWKRVDLKTLDLLCNVFECTPNDLLDFTPDID